MVNNFILRLISGIFLLIIAISSIAQGGLCFQALMAICGILMLYEWININKNKGTNILFWSGTFYITIPIIFWIWNSHKNPSLFASEIYWCFIIVWACDIFAYLGGKLLQGPKFAPQISPNKTWSGVLTGGIFSFIISYFYIVNIFEKKTSLIIASLFMIIASILGDLLESKIKRILKVKDSGNIIPGHGGICDRLDSFLLVTYVFLIIKFILL